MHSKFDDGVGYNRCGHIESHSFCVLVIDEIAPWPQFLSFSFFLYNIFFCSLCCSNRLFSIFQLTWIIIRHSICLSIWKRVCLCMSAMLYILTLWQSRNGDYILWKDRVPSIHSSCRWFFFLSLFCCRFV